jgi:hypothetical protein
MNFWAISSKSNMAVIRPVICYGCEATNPKSKSSDDTKQLHEDDWKTSQRNKYSILKCRFLNS